MVFPLLPVCRSVQCTVVCCMLVALSMKCHCFNIQMSINNSETADRGETGTEQANRLAGRGDITNGLLFGGADVGEEGGLRNFGRSQMVSCLVGRMCREA